MICSACGTSNKPGARYCASCGTPLTGGDVPTVGPDPRPVPPAPPAPAPDREPRRGRDIALWAAVVLVSIAIVVAIVVALQSRDQGDDSAVREPDPTLPTTETTAATTTTVFREPVTAPPRPTVPSVPRPIGQKETLRELADIMSESEVGRMIVNETINNGIYANCSVSAAYAVDQLDIAIDNRRLLVARLDDLGARSTAPQLPAMLRDALELSRQADVLFRQWLVENRDDPSRRCDYSTGTETSALAVSGQSTTAKIAFVDRYNEQAARAGLRFDWTKDDF
jgi:hypothetical protein